MILSIPLTASTSCINAHGLNKLADLFAYYGHHKLQRLSYHYSNSVSNHFHSFNEQIYHHFKHQLDHLFNHKATDIAQLPNLAAAHNSAGLEDSLAKASS